MNKIYLSIALLISLILLFPFETWSQTENPSVEFWASTTEICPSTEVTFQALPRNLYGYEASYSWTFQGGYPSLATGLGPHTISYGSSGLWAVSLTMHVGELEYTYTLNKDNYITVFPVTTLQLVSPGGLEQQGVCENNPIADITYTAEGYPSSLLSVSGLPNGVSAWGGDWSLTITGSPQYSGVYSYVVHANGLCGTATASGTITVYATPVISDYEVLYVCSGSQKQLYGTGSPAAVNPWVSGNSSVATIDDNGLVTGITEGTSVIAYTDSHGCGTTSLLTVKPLPSAPEAGSNSPVTGGNAISLGASSIADATYFWTGPNGFSSAGQYVNVPEVATNAMEGTYSVTATVNGCTGPAGTTDVVVNFAPVITEGGFADLSCDEDAALATLTLHVTDDDGDPVTWSVNRVPWEGTAGISGTGTAREISYTPNGNFYGYDSFELIVSDSYGLTDYITVNVAVNAVNDPPLVITPISDQVFNESFINGSIDISGVFSDPEYDQLTFTGATSSNESVVTVSIAGQTLWLTAAGMGQSLVTITVTDGTGSAEDQFIVVIRPDDIEQSISLTTGWNMLSFGAQPEDMSIRNIADPLIVANLLTKVQNEEGKALERLSEPVGWINEIGDIAPTEGYKVRVTGETNLSITGQPVTIPMDIPLEAGWNIIGYPSVTTQWSENIFAPLVQEGTLLKVQDEEGNAIEKIGDEWIYGITSLEPGKGYGVKVSSNTVLSIGQGVKGEAPEKEGQSNRTQHFVAEYIGNGLDHMNIYIEREEGSHLRQGYGGQRKGRMGDRDEIGVFDGEICVGSAVVENGGKYIQVIASFDDPETVEKDGFAEGNEIELRLWDRESGEEVKVETEDKAGYSNVFERQGTTVLRAKIPGEAVSWLGDAYPNPSGDRTTFTFGLAGESRVRLEIIDVVGNTVAIVVDETMPGGIHRVEWNNTTSNGSKTRSGMYFYCLLVNGMIEAGQLIIH